MPCLLGLACCLPGQALGCCCHAEPNNSWCTCDLAEATAVVKARAPRASQSGRPAGAGRARGQQGHKAGKQQAMLAAWAPFAIIASQQGAGNVRVPSLVRDPIK